MKRLVFPLLLFFAIPLFGVDARLDSLMQKLQKKYETLEGLKASFSQSYVSKRFSDQLKESGVVYFQKGGKMKWEYRDPEPKVFVSDGSFYYYYVPEDKQMVKAPVEKGGDQRSPTLFLAGRGNFLKDFRYEWADPRPGSHLVKLTPIQPQGDFKNLILDIDPVTGLILRLLVTDEFENRTEYRFSQMQENPQLSTSFFAFQPPPGTDVIYQRKEAE